MATVTFNGVRVNAADSATGWSNRTGGGPAPASEPQLKYQGTGAVNRKVTSTTARAGVQYAAGTTRDMTTTYPLMFAKGKVADAGDLNATYGCEFAIGSASGAYYEYNVAGSGANNDFYTDGYNSQGGLAEGYLITAINPNVSQWREATAGSPSLTAVDYYAFAAQFVTGGAKSENVACDAIDIGTGLDYTGTSFTFQDAVDTDQGNTSNRWGCACQNGLPISLRGKHRLGAGGVALSGTDESIVLFPDGYHDSGDSGIEYDASNASTTANLNGTYIGLGRVYGANDTRPDFVITGTAGSRTLSPTLSNHRNVTLTSAIDLDGADIECQLLTQGSAEIQNCTIRTDSVTSVACLQDITSGAATGVHDTTFIQSGAGHAIEISSDITLYGLFFEGYGATGTDSAALDITATSGTVTVTVSNGGTPTYKSAGATVVISNPRTMTVSGIPNGLEVRFRRGSFTLYHVQNVTGNSASYVYVYSDDFPITITIGGVADDTIAYERRDLNVIEKDSDQNFIFDPSINPSYS